MSFFGIPFLSTEEPPMLKKNEQDRVFGNEEEEPVLDETKDEQNDRLAEEEQENRAPVDDHYSALPEGEAPVNKDGPIVDVTPAQVEAMDSPRTPLECDYDVDPTKLYEYLQARDWDASTKRCKENEKEARTWVSRKEKNGKLRWRLLPLHAAVIFKAPDIVIEALLASYPRGAESKDDQGMLPLHLAFRNGSNESVVTLLLTAYPKSIDVKDRKGRIPLALAQASTSPNRDAFMRALERGPLYYATAAAATERAAVTAEQQTMFDAKLREKEESYQEELAMLRVDAEQKQMDYQEKIKRLEQDLAKTQETSQVLVDHVNTLEAQLSSRTDTERFLATRIAALDVDLRETARGKEDLESTLKEENENLKAEKMMLQDELKALKEEHTVQAEKLTSTADELVKVRGEKHAKHEEILESLVVLQKEWASAKASEAVLEAQLKKRIKSERALASEVSFLASRLAESAHESGESVKDYTSRVKALEKERDELRITVKALSAKLADVANALEEMMIGQEKILEASTKHEENMVESIEIHRKLVSHAKRHQDLYETAQKEREELVTAFMNHEEKAAKQIAERRAILEAFELQEEQMEDSTTERKDLVAQVEEQCLGIQSLIENNFTGSIAPVLTMNDDEVVDEMVKLVMSTDTDMTQKVADPMVEESVEEKIPETTEKVADPVVEESVEEKIPETTEKVADLVVEENVEEKIPLSLENALKRIDARTANEVKPKQTEATIAVKPSYSVEEALKRIESLTNKSDSSQARQPEGKVFNFEGVSKDVEDEVQSVRDAP